MGTEDESTETTVVVVEDTAPPPAPQYVTAGELDAKLELMEQRLSTRIGDAMSGAMNAESVAFDAAATATEAESIAGLALEVAEDAAQESQEDGPAGAGDAPEGGPQPPLKKEDREDSTGHEAEKESKPKRGYGSSLIYGNN